MARKYSDQYTSVIRFFFFVNKKQIEKAYEFMSAEFKMINCFRAFKEDLLLYSDSIVSNLHVRYCNDGFSELMVSLRNPGKKYQRKKPIELTVHLRREDAGWMVDSITGTDVQQRIQ